MNTIKICKGLCSKAFFDNKTLIICFLFILILTGCGQKDVLLKDANPDNSALGIYYYNGDKVERKFIYDKDKIVRVIKDLNSAEISLSSKSTKKEVKYPYYSLEISNKNGYDISVSLINNQLYTSDNKIYDINYDFNKLFELDDWCDKEEFDDLTVFPNIRKVAIVDKVITGEDAKDDKNVDNYTSWDKNLLSESATETGPEEIDAKVVGNNSSDIVIEFKNNSKGDWIFGTYYAIEVNLEGKWYTVPVEKSNYGFEDIAIVLSPGKSTEQKYNIDMYGKLPKGKYRIVVDGIKIDLNI